MEKGHMEFVKAPARQVPVLCDVDVAVAGGGVSGVFAAIAAARNGADTAIIDRFGSLGGNIGPGMCPPGAMLTMGSGLVKNGVPREYVYGGTTGIPKEFADRFISLGGGVYPSKKLHHLRDPNITSYLISKMLDEAGVRMVLSTYVADPVLENSKVKGVFIENKSGRQAIRATVTIDATGEADLARRAGAPIIYPKESYFELDTHAPSGVGFWCFVGGVNWKKYDLYAAGHAESDKGDVEWSKEKLTWEYPSHILPLLRAAWERGGYSPVKEIDGLASVRSWVPKIRHDSEGVAGFKIQLERPHGKVDMGDGAHVSSLEKHMRRFCFETAKFWRDDVPGFEDSYIVSISPFLGSRGGPCIEGEYILTTDDCRVGKRFEDVVYVYGEPRALRYTCKELGECRWTDVPYRVMLPKNVDGLLAVGRSASCIPDTLLRNRVAVMHMGQVAGTAAVLCVKDGVDPRNLDAKKLQRKLLESGFYLGDEPRLKGLGLG